MAISSKKGKLMSLSQWKMVQQKNSESKTAVEFPRIQQQEPDSSTRLHEVSTLPPPSK